MTITDHSPNSPTSVVKCIYGNGYGKLKTNLPFINSALGYSLPLGSTSQELLQAAEKMFGLSAGERTCSACSSAGERTCSAFRLAVFLGHLTADSKLALGHSLQTASWH